MRYAFIRTLHQQTREEHLLCTESFPRLSHQEAADGQSGLEVYWSRRIDRVVVSPSATRQEAACWGDCSHSSCMDGLEELAKKNGACVCFVKRHTTGVDLDRAIQRTVGVGGTDAQGRLVPAYLIFSILGILSLKRGKMKTNGSCFSDRAIGGVCRA